MAIVRAFDPRDHPRMIETLRQWPNYFRIGFRIILGTAITNEPNNPYDNRWGRARERQAAREVENHDQENHDQENHDQANHDQANHDQANHDQVNHDQENHDQENDVQENDNQGDGNSIYDSRESINFLPDSNYYLI